MQPLSPHLPLLRQAGLVLVVVGLFDVGLMIYAIANKVSYSSSLNLFAVVGGVFLQRGNLRAASIVRWLALFLFAGMATGALCLPLLIPPGLLLTHVQVQPMGSLGSLALTVGALVLFGWLARQLSLEPVKAARLAAGRKERHASVPLLLGVSLSAILAGVNLWGQHSDAAARAVSEAKAQLGDEYQYHVSSINVRSNAEGTTTSGVVTAWKRGTIRSLPFQRRE